MSKNYSYQSEDMKKLFYNFKRLHLLVIGDLILDNYIWGTVKRISPEAPVPIISVEKKESRIGGAGNVAANLASLGSKVTIAGLCGNDKESKILSDLFDQEGIEHLITSISNRKTTVKSRVIAQHQQLIRIDEENVDPVKKEINQAILDNISSSNNNFDGVILSDYSKGLLTAEFIKEILYVFKAKPVIIDPKGYDYNKYRGATTIKPNFKEFCTAVNHPELRKDDLEKHAKILVHNLDLGGIVVTLGKDGVFILDNKGENFVIPTKAKEVYDVSGAGDTFIAVFSAGLILSGNWFIAAKAGNLASGVAVGKLGTATVSIGEIFNNNNSKK